MLKYIIPKIPFDDLPALLGWTVAGILIAGSYGILHDQVTYAIGPEYFHNFKFQQFAYANPGLGDRVFVSCIGFLATWWVGLIVGWILARRCLPGQPRHVARRQILQGFSIVFATVFAAGLAGFAYGLLRGPDADYSVWQSAFERHGVIHRWSFIRVGYIHNAGYMGGAIGLILTYVCIRPQPFTDDQLLTARSTDT